VAVAGVEWRPHPPDTADPVDHIVCDAIALMLAPADLIDEHGLLRLVAEQIPQQAARALGVRTRLLDQAQQSVIERSSLEEFHGASLTSAAPARRSSHALFTTRSPIDNTGARAAREPCGCMETIEDRDDVLHAGELEIRLTEGLVRAAGRVLTLSVREFELLVAMARRSGGILRRDELYRAVWGSDLRRGDRSVDVYVSKLRCKLDAALPDERYIHTHPGFGYRFQPQPSQDLDNRPPARMQTASGDRR